ncbi:hypothetical protein N0V90_012516 [Kalmusia sp. IMI 367209]|nr:hypothetical protein N0V90_012516 [Kalmusia sp. IMI 367209]
MDSEAQHDEKQTFPEITQAAKEDEVIDFDGEDDPTDPQNWSSLYKWSIVIVISLLSLEANLGMLMCAPALPDILDEFRSTSKIQSTLVLMIWELGEVVCPLVVAPLCDMFPKERRGRALGIMGIIPFTAPILGPIAGGFVTQAKSWRWAFWLVVIITAPVQIVFMVLYRETYRVKILEKKAAALGKSAPGPLHHRYRLGKPRNIVIRDTCLRPLKMLFVSRLVVMLGICSALSTSLVYTLVASLSIIYDEQYHFRQGLLGLTYLGLGKYSTTDFWSVK